MYSGEPTDGSWKCTARHWCQPTADRLDGAAACAARFLGVRQPIEVLGSRDPGQGQEGRKDCCSGGALFICHEVPPLHMCCLLRALYDMTAFQPLRSRTCVAGETGQDLL